MRRVYSELPPVPGRQPTYESVDVALNRLIKTLGEGDASAQQEAAFGLCLRSQEEGSGFERLIDAGVLGPLVSLVTDGATDAAKACACVTLGLIAAVYATELLQAGLVPALLDALRSSPATVGQYAALALSNLAEEDRAHTAAALLATPPNLQLAPLVEPLARDDLDAAVLEACAGALVNLCDPTNTLRGSGAAGAGAASGVSSHAFPVAKAVEPLMGRLQLLAAGGGRVLERTPTENEARQELIDSATALVANVQLILAAQATPASEPFSKEPTAAPSPCKHDVAHQKRDSCRTKSKKCAIM
jgi:hypothetical protein